MGDQVGSAIGGTLCYVPREEFSRVLSLNCSNFDKVALFSTLCRINILFMVARCGSGHIGSSFSSIDIMSWMHLIHLRGQAERNNINSSKDIFFSSKGHDAPALYSVLMALGKLDFQLIHQLRRLGGLPGHPDISTPHIVTNTGSLGMGVSKAKGMIIANRLKQLDGEFYVLTGDGELQEGQFWESLASAANNNLHELTVIIDHNKLQSDTLVSTVSDLGNLPQKLRSFGLHVARCDGHNLPELADLLINLRGVKDKPKVIIADTIKGKGVSFMEHTSIDSDVELYKYHSGAPSAESYTKATRELINRADNQLSALGLHGLELEYVERPDIGAFNEPQRLVAAYTESLVKHAEKNLDIVVLDADLILDTGLIPFKDRFPERFIECGIAEQDMVSQAGGMALGGLLPIVHSFSCFLTARPAEQIYNNSTERKKIIYVGSLAGIIPGGPGHSHQGIRDISLMSAIPEMTVVEPSCAAEVNALLDWAISTNAGSTYIRLMSIPVDINFSLPADYTPKLGEGVRILPGNDSIIFAYGPQLLSNAVSAALTLAEKQGLQVGVVNLPWLNYIDSEWLTSVIGFTKHVFCIDNHYVIGGQGDRIAALIAGDATQDTTLTAIGITGFPAFGKNEEVLRFHKLTPSDIAATVIERLTRN